MVYGTNMQTQFLVPDRVSRSSRKLFARLRSLGTGGRAVNMTSAPEEYSLIKSLISW